MSNKLVLSNLPHTWIFDVDGTLCVHNGYKVNGKDELLTGVKEVFDKIPQKDMIIVLTARHECEKASLDAFMQEYGLRYDHVIFDVPFGERILINDDKPSGLKMAHAINKKRDGALDIQIVIDKEL